MLQKTDSDCERASQQNGKACVNTDGLFLVKTHRNSKCLVHFLNFPSRKDTGVFFFCEVHYA